MSHPAKGGDRSPVISESPRSSELSNSSTASSRRVDGEAQQEQLNKWESNYKLREAMLLSEMNQKEVEWKLKEAMLLSELKQKEWKLREAALLLEIKHKEVEMKLGLEEKRTKLQQLQAEKENKNHPILAKTCDSCKSLNYYVDEIEVNATEKETKGITTTNSDVTAVLPQPGSPEISVAQEPFGLAQASSICMNIPQAPQPPTFSRKPLKCIDRKTSSMSSIDRKSLPTTKMVTLKNCPVGDARQAVEGFLHSDRKKSRKDVLAVLQERTYSPSLLERVFREKLMRWPKIKDNDPLALKAFVDFLKSCSGAVKHGEELDFLNSCEENFKLLEKMPQWITQKWSQIVVDELETSGEYPDFACFTEFLKTESQTLCSHIASPPIMTNKSWDHRSLKQKRSTLPTNTTPQLVSSSKMMFCLFCKKEGHDITRCPIFAAKTLECKKTFIHANRLCFGCLKKGHFIKECKRRHICSTCHRRHPTSLHTNTIKRPANIANNDFTPIVDHRKAGVNKVLFHSSAKRSSATSSIVPVFVSSIVEPDKEVLTYAILDAQSSSTFILEDVLDKLNVGIQSVKLKLSTMTATDTIIASKNVQDLQVKGLNLDCQIQIKQAYARDFIPMNKGQIPTSQTALQWPHLEHLADKLPPFQDCNVGLLIGYDCPSALAPLEVIVGTTNEAFAQRTQLGWSIVGPSNPNFDWERTKSDPSSLIQPSEGNHM
ncbi:uncharacterized protein LOC133478666 [Phyllopteryx taeniolatus]|uniref:uncharacterized protein LOC133478666 n=1 Tax=Phyllopteryx taeniolatus TaxID=161469 RepID=UPI002AD2C2F0|nr:uncharacterized protein LOC133478666 [Phyllopteryx taeniolatus]XP_061630984.1 uncharacterized protein LOC133478666 [Phyllopteryx taeniolatus]